MVKKTYQTPKMKVCTINDIDSLKKSNDIQDTWKVGSLIRGATEKELSNLFLNGIDKDIKRQSDVLELYEIKGDIYNHKDISDINSIPKMSGVSRWQSAINIFTNIKEEIIGEIINFIDIPDYINGICNDIRIIQPQIEGKRKFTNEENVKNVGFKYIISTIRNGLMHNRYLITKNGLYIHSEKAWRKKTSKKDANGNNIVEEKDFEAFIDLSFFLKIIKFSFLSERRQKVKTLDISKIDRKKGFDENVRNLRLKGFESKEKGLLYSNLQDKILNRVNEERGGKVQHYNYIQLSNGQKEFMSEYFKVHEFNRQNLEFLGGYFESVCRNERVDLGNDYISIGINSYFLGQKEYFQIYFSTIKDVILRAVMNSFLEGNEPYSWKIWQDDIGIKQNIEKGLASLGIRKPYTKYNAKRVIETEEMVLDLKYIFLNLKDRLYSRISFRKSYLKVLYLSKFYVNNPKLILAQPEKRVGDSLWKQGYNYFLAKCRENPRFYWSNEAKKNHIDQALGRPFRERLFKNLTRGKVDKRIIKDTDNVDQVMDKIDLFVTKSKKHLSEDHQQILENNIRNTVKERKEKLDSITIIGEEEHIRNAFAHHNYTIIPGFDKILLRDPSIDDTPNWEKIYNLDELYQNCVNRVDECFLNKESSN